MKKAMSWGIVSLIVLMLAACATTGPPPGTPTVERFVRPPVGSTWVLAQRNTGSFGKDSRQITVTVLGERDFQNRKLWAVGTDGKAVSYSDAEGRYVGRTRDGVPEETMEPGFQSFAWPLFVGKSWVHTYRYTDHVQGRTFDNSRFSGKVEAWEDVRTPAGTFKAFRIVHEDPNFRIASWWSPEHGIYVKSKSERATTYYLSAGVRETELVSMNLKK